MIVESLHPDVIVDDIREATGWDVQFADEVAETRAPTDEELGPDGVYLE
ncbi:hypothetical protein [Natronorubrum tibetense]|uniref:Coenzyme A transferase n=1 Tax=Natronorubrum tibetense GA33 TaxID=1114856 RepID=L9VP24_9EURY|nr:hypothetical protein [Natronorubrum tibetense]ELY38904.1 coenzyme A transferase [Natronorubrum tibetense GA33]